MTTLYSDNTTEHRTPCAIYVRTACHDAVEIDRLVQACSARAIALDTVVDFVFVDSDTVFGQGIDRLFEVARIGSIDYVIVPDRECVGRYFSVQRAVLKELATAGVEVEIASEPFRPLPDAVVRFP